MDQERDDNLECHLGTHEKHANERGWWKVKEMKWDTIQVAHYEWEQ